MSFLHFQPILTPLHLTVLLKRVCIAMAVNLVATMASIIAIHDNLEMGYYNYTTWSTPPATPRHQKLPMHALHWICARDLMRLIHVRTSVAVATAARPAGPSS